MGGKTRVEQLGLEIEGALARELVSQRLDALGSGDGDGGAGLVDECRDALVAAKRDERGRKYRRALERHGCGGVEALRLLAERESGGR